MEMIVLKGYHLPKCSQRSQEVASSSVKTLIVFLERAAKRCCHDHEGGRAKKRSTRIAQLRYHGDSS